MFVFSCQPENDLYRVLENMGRSYPRCDSFADAVEAAPPGGAVLALADAYPRADLEVDTDVLNRAAAKGLRLYIEYPATLPGIEMGEPHPTQWERVVVPTDFFGPSLPVNSILALHGCWFLPVWAEAPHLVAARAAGYRHAVYGLPGDAFPILFELPGHTALVAASKLSQFVTGRYGPTSDWKTVWERILHWLAPSENVPELRWEPTVGVQSGPNHPLPETAEEDARRRCVHWFRKHIVYSIDWKKGAAEGFESSIDHEGRQFGRRWIRGDCIGETGMVFASDWAVTRNPASRRLSGQILDYVWSTPDFRQGDRNSPVYGLNNWYERGPVFYGDDNSRVILSTLLASRLTGEERWDEHVLRCLLANLRTTGPLGFREGSLYYPASFPDGRGWEYYRDTPVVEYAPHYQSYLWAAFLWAYALTGCGEFLDKPKNAIRMTMEAYPEWRWTNGLTQEIARMLLPLAFLVRIEDTREHRAWLERMVEDLLAQMQPCGAIRELLGPLENGTYPPPQSNAAYGTSEASLIQENGDPACDLLYTTSYAFLGLHEAAAATGDARIKDAEDRLADFLCRIQVRSTAHPYLDGAWMRGFDYDLWEYWGSSSDLGWGACCVESGWTNSWISTVLALRVQSDAVFDLTIADRLKARFPALLTEMMEERAAEPAADDPAPQVSRPGSE